MSFMVSVKNSQSVLIVYAIGESDTGETMFFAYDAVEQTWRWILADNCVPNR